MYFVTFGSCVIVNDGSFHKNQSFYTKIYLCSVCKKIQVVEIEHDKFRDGGKTVHVVFKYL